MSYTQKTFALSNAAQFVIPLDGDRGSVSILARGEVYIRAGVFASDAAATAAAPAADPTPVAPAGTNLLQATAGERITWGADPTGQGLVVAIQEPVTHLIGWAKAAANIVVLGH